MKICPIRAKTIPTTTPERLYLKHHYPQPKVDFVPFVKNASDKTGPAVTLRQVIPTTDSTLGHAICQVDTWDMLRSLPSRTCRFERLEPRQLLAANALASPGQLDLSIENPTAQPAQVTPSSISGRVQMATDSHCQNSPDEEGLSGVTIHLLDEIGIVIEVTQTDPTGEYQFANLSSGIYAVHEVQPAGMTDHSAHVGSGGGIAFDKNLLGEIQVFAGSNLVGYNFCEQHDQGPAQSGGEELPLVDQHSGIVEPNEVNFSAGAAWQLLYRSSSEGSSQAGQLFDSPVSAVRSNVRANSAPAIQAAEPFYGTFTHADPQSNSDDRNGNGFDSLDLFQDDVWQFDIDFGNWFASNSRIVLFEDTSNQAAEANQTEEVDDKESRQEDSWMLDRLAKIDLDAEDYDRVFEEDGNQEATAVKIEPAAEEVQKLTSLPPRA